jgi:hypothetical protein
VTRSLLLILAVYAPHLLEEALTGMYDDPIIVAAYAPLASLSARHAAYLVFQLMLVLALGMTLLATLGHRARSVLLGALAAALLGESHHILRALVTHAYNSGLVTATPMLVVGVLLARRVLASSFETTAATARPLGVFS